MRTTLESRSAPLQSVGTTKDVLGDGGPRHKRHRKTETVRTFDFFELHEATVITDDEFSGTTTRREGRPRTRVEMFRARLGAVHDRVAPVKLYAVAGGELMVSTSKRLVIP